VGLRYSRFAIAVILIAAPAAAQKSAPKLKSFDPTVPGACEKAVGPQDDDSAIGARGWVVACGDLDKDIENSEFAALRASEAKAGKTHSAAYGALIGAFEKYRAQQLHLYGRSCGGGTGCGSMMIQEEARINFAFLIMAEGFRGAGFPSYSANDFAEADAALNKAYKESMANYSPACAPEGSASYDENCVSRGELRAMERAWINYRDAWVTFGAIKWPQVSADSWQTYLTRERVNRGGDGTSD
jgi:hypothetical protein